MACTYNQRTERFSDCDGHNRCLCADDDTVTADPPRTSAHYTSTTLIAELAEERRRRLAVETAAAELLQLIDLPLEALTVARLRTCATVTRLRDVVGVRR